ncbi:MAG TPA: TonB-dependent receptor [Candidatus Sulfopaludibacter sp.]|jgi:outer membrane receptor protein involved in Fe transport|nr:TonB-dependent receptor [Candidatus Sulfopaludibacter sp.]
MSKTTTTILSLLLLFCGLGTAQNITGSISGRVVDAQGASVLNAAVTLTETGKNQSNTVKTTAGGDFTIAGLVPGTYSIAVEAVGFKKLTRPGIALDANTKLAVGDLTLEVGAVTESIEVTGTAALLQTESVERSATITGKQIENIEVNGRNALDMAKLVPGVQFTNGTSYAIGSSSNGANDFTVNGARPSQNQLSINGIGNVDTGNNGGMNVAVSVDSVAEFKILTGSYQAEYGRSVGAQISVVTKTGSEQFHGSTYWYHRNDGLNANTYLNNVRGLAKPLFRYNDLGYTIGGPVYIPHVFERERHKAFFFLSQEWQKQLSPNTARNVLVPTALERKGDFSQSLNNNGQKLTFINDPLTQTPFPNMQVPANRIYGVGQNLLNLYPLPNVTQVSNFNYTSQFPGEAPRRETLVRADYNLTEKIRFFGHFIDNQQPTVAPYGSFVLGLSVPITQIENPIPGRSVAAGATITISPTMTNEFNWGFTHNSILIAEQGTVLRTNTSNINLPELYPSAVQDNYVPNVTFNGTRINASPNLGTGDAPFINYNTTIDISDNLTKVWRSHTIKAGLYMQRSRKDQTSFANFNGSYNFGDNASNPYDTGYGFSNALLGVYNTYNQAANHVNGMYRYWNIEQFVQDTWKLTPRLTLDFGMRAAWYQPQFDSSLQASTFLPDQWTPSKAPRLYQPAINPANGQRAAFDPATNSFLPSFDVGLEIPGSGDPFQAICQSKTCPNGKYLMQDRGLQLGPRFGFAWDVTGKQNLVVRSGGGIYYDRIQGNRTFDMVTNPPEAVSPTLNQNLVSTIDPKNILLGPPSLDAVDQSGKVPTTYQYNFGVQYRLPENMSLDVAYVGSMGRHLQDNRNINYNAFGQCFQPQNQDPQLQAANPTALLGNNCLAANFLKPYQGYSNINYYQGEATSNYNALQVQVQRRTTKGLFFGVAYTWSKALSTAQSGGTNDNSFVRPDQYNSEANYGPSSFDRRQVLAINYVYTTPRLSVGNGFTRIFTDGWQLSGVTQAVTGSPFTPGFSVSGAGNQNITGSNTEGARIGVVAGCDPYTHSSDPFNRLNPNCFFAPSPGSIGLESGINFLYGPAIVNFDMALQKEFTVKERFRFQLRLDAFNVFNHTDFIGYNGTLNFNAYPTTNGRVTGLPSITTTALGRNANGTFNVTGFGTATQTGPGALGYSRILQTMIRFWF